MGNMQQEQQCVTHRVLVCVAGQLDECSTCQTWSSRRRVESHTCCQLCRRPPATPFQLHQQHVFDAHDLETHESLHETAPIVGMYKKCDRQLDFLCWWVGHEPWCATAVTKEAHPLPWLLHPVMDEERSRAFDDFPS